MELVIMQFVDYNKKTHEMKYKFYLAKAFLKGYYGGKNISKEKLYQLYTDSLVY